MHAREESVRKLSILKEHENRQKKCYTYFSVHNFTRQDRMVIVDWIHASSVYFGFGDSVFFHAVGYFDKTLSWKSSRPMGVDQLQCFAACCVWTAVSEVVSPGAVSIADILDWNRDDPFCTENNVRHMYHFINQRFKFRTFIVTPYDFLIRFLTVLEMSKVHNLTWMSLYLLELSQYCYWVCLDNYSPSLVAAAALFAALQILKHINSWIPDLTHLAEYEADDPDFIIVSDILNWLFVQASITDKYQSVYRKYSLVSRKCVAQIRV